MCCRTIYEKLGSAFSEEQQNFYQQKAEEITPNIRYCAYNLDDGNVDINELMKMRFSSGTGAQDLLADKLDVRMVKLQTREYCTTIIPMFSPLGEFFFWVTLPASWCS